MFATDPSHYDFTSMRCVKDLQFDGIFVDEAGRAILQIELRLAPNRFKHASGLTIRYTGATKVILECDLPRPNHKVWPASRRLGDLQLDEILPIATGCAHEIRFTGGTIVVECSDLRAEWGSEVLPAEGEGPGGD
jgi:hypothetical protein